MKTHFLSIMLIVFSISTYAQKNKEQIKALKVAHITDRLSLTEKEAQQFWPIYNAYDDATSKIRHKEMREIRKEIRQDTESLSDKEANDLLERL